MLIIGKQFYRGQDQTEIFIPSNVEGDWVEFQSGAKCKLSTFFQEFVEIDKNISSILESKEISDDFFNQKINENSPILNQLEQALHGNSGPTEKLKMSQSLDGGFKNNDLANRFNDNTSTIKQIPNPIINENNGTIQTNIQSQSNRLPEWDAFDRVKKTEMVEFNIPIKLKLPKPDKIRAVDDMFDSSYISYIAKNWIETELNGRSKSFSLAIQQQIKQWIENSLESPKKKSKKIVKDKKYEQSQINNGPSATEMFGLGNNKTIEWNGDVKSLMEISSQEQLDKVKLWLADETDINEKARLEMLIIDWVAKNGN